MKTSAGLCECGCGTPTVISPYTNRRLGYRKGHPRRFAHGHNRRLDPAHSVAARFWAKVEKREGAESCWLWRGHRADNGYGTFGSRSVMAHRMAYLLEKGPIPGGAIIRHSCDQRACVRPDHLVPGTHRDNVRDGFTRGRYPQARLTAIQAKAIREAYFSDPAMLMRDLAKRYGVRTATISGIVRGRRWAQAGGPVLANKAARKRRLVYPSGEALSQSRLTIESVTQLRVERATGMTYEALGTRYGISREAARKAVLGKTWRQVR